MAIEVSCAVWNWSKQKGSRLLLLVCIADYANAEGVAWPSIASLSRRTRMGSRFVQKMLRELEDCGEIVTIKRTNTSNVYRVTVREPDAKPGANSGSPPASDSPGGESLFASGANSGSPNPSIEPSKNVLENTAEAIYQAFPRKIAKAAALKSIRKALATVPAQKLLSATLAYAAAVARWPEEDKRFIPYPATWFNRGSYDDDPQNWTRTHDTHNEKSNGRSFGGGNLAAFADLDRQLAAGA